MKQKIGLYIVLIAVLVLPALAIGDEVVTIPAGETIKIGVMAPLASDVLAQFGETVLRGVELALEDRVTVSFNEVVFPVELVHAESMCSAEGGLSAAKELVATEGLIGVIGPVCTSALNAALPVLDEAGVLVISPTSAGFIEELGLVWGINRLYPTDGQLARAAADFVIAQGIDTAAVMYEDSFYGRNMSTAFEDHYKALDGRLATMELYVPGLDYYPDQLRSVASSGANMLVIFGFSTDLPTIIEMARENANFDDIQFLIVENIPREDLIEQSRGAAEGIYVIGYPQLASDGFVALTERYEAEYGEEPSNVFYGYAYDAANILVDAIETSGEVNDNGDLIISRAATRIFVRELEGYEGVTGVLTCDDAGDCATIPFPIFQIENGEFIELDQ